MINPFFEIKSKPIHNWPLLEAVYSEPVDWVYFPYVIIELNKFNNVIVRFWIGGKDDHEVERYIAAIVDLPTFVSYVTGKITLLKLFEIQEQLFIVDEYMDGFDVYPVKIEEIPEVLLPGPKSKFPCFDEEEVSEDE